MNTGSLWSVHRPPILTNLSVLHKDFNFCPFIILFMSLVFNERENLPSKMSGKGSKGVELSGDIEFMKTPTAKVSAFGTGEDCGVKLSSVCS